MFLLRRLLPGRRSPPGTSSTPSPSRVFERGSRSVSLSINRGRPTKARSPLIWKLKVSISGENAGWRRTPTAPTLYRSHTIPVAGVCSRYGGSETGIHTGLAHTGRSILQPVWCDRYEKNTVFAPSFYLKFHASTPGFERGPVPGFAFRSGYDWGT